MRNVAPVACLAALILGISPAFASPPTPTGAHPRLFMSAAELQGYTAKAAASGTAASTLVRACQDTLDEPNMYEDRGGSDGDYWAGSAVRCAFAFLATGKDDYRKQAIKYWRASLDDYDTRGDGKGCVAGVDTNWQSWDGSQPAPPILATVTRDTGYPIRWYGPAMALVYDWLHDATGVDDGLRAQTRTCLGAWIDWYSKSGYHHDEVGANYNAGFVIAKALAGIAIGDDDGADGHIWQQTTDDLFPNLMVKDGLAGSGDLVGDKAGVLVGGDWLEGWEYGPLSVLEYAISARALAEHGAAQPELAAWSDALAIRFIHAQVPDKSGGWVGGDFDDNHVYAQPSVNVLDAVLAAQSADASASFALSAKQGLGAGIYVYNAIAELRDVAPVDYASQTPAPSRWYVARGTRAMFARTSWDASAFWATFTSAPAIVSDHLHFSASNFVFTRGADHLVVDASNYGEYDTLGTNAVTADSTVAQDEYHGTQTPWSKAELLWARGTDDAVYAARADFAKAFIFSSTPSDIPYAHREWVMLPEGEVVTVDRVHTKGATHPMTVGFHTNTGGGGLTLSGDGASGTVGGSKVVIHAVSLSGGSPEVAVIAKGDCPSGCSYPCGSCDVGRFKLDKYTVSVPGPEAVAIHVIDGLAAGEDAAIVGTMNDDAVDPAPKTNAGVIGAAVFRGGKQSYVVASSADDGATPATMTYGVPGDGPSRHVVFDAPEAADGSSLVVGAAMGGRCVITITAGAGFPGHPLMFKVASAADGCAATPATDVGPGDPPTGDGGGGSGPSTGSMGSGGHGASTGSHTGSGAGSSAGGASGAGGNGDNPAGADDSGCGCRTPGDAPSDSLAMLAIAAAVVVAKRRRR